MTTSRGELAPELEELLSDAVDSFEKLEIVLHLNRSTAAIGTYAIATAIAVPTDITADALKALATSGVVVSTGVGWLLSRTGPWSEHFASLVRAAEVDRTELFRFLSARAMDRVRAEAARVFADAFILRPKKKGGPDA